MCRDKPQRLHFSQASSQQPHLCFLSPVVPTKLPVATTGAGGQAVAFSMIVHLLVEISTRNELPVKEVTGRFFTKQEPELSAEIIPYELKFRRGERGGERGRGGEGKRRGRGERRQIQRDRSYSSVKDTTRPSEWTSKLWTGRMLQTRAKLSWTSFSPFESSALSTPGTYLTPHGHHSFTMYS